MTEAVSMTPARRPVADASQIHAEPAPRELVMRPEHFFSNTFHLEMEGTDAGREEALASFRAAPTRDEPGALSLVLMILLIGVPALVALTLFSAA